jgi:hypothetical protein
LKSGCKTDGKPVVGKIIAIVAIGDKQQLAVESACIANAGWFFEHTLAFDCGFAIQPSYAKKISIVFHPAMHSKPVVKLTLKSVDTFV